MATKKPHDLKFFIFPLNMNGLQGQMLKVPARYNSREILLIYGHHATLERWFGLVHELLRYGGVTMPDLPGFGGMEGLHKIGEKPTLDIYADYMAAFIKLRYKQRRLTIVAEGFGFLIATRMLQRYKNVAKKVDLIVSLGGYAHYEDLQFNRRQLVSYRIGSNIFSLRLLAWTFRRVYLNSALLKRAYRERLGSLRRLLEATVFPAKASEQIELWMRCDLATHMATINILLSVNNCDDRVDVPVIIVNLPGNVLVNKHLAEQHLQVAFSDCQFLEAKIGRRKIFGNDAKTASVLLPHRLRAKLKQTRA